MVIGREDHGRCLGSSDQVTFVLQCRIWRHETGQIQSLARADLILEALAEKRRRDGQRLQDVVARTGLKPVTALTLLQSLVALRLAEQVGKREALPAAGRASCSWGGRSRRGWTSSPSPRPPSFASRQQSGEMVNLLIPAATTMVVVESLRGEVFLKATPLKGRDLPMHGTASGKCFLAFSSDDVQRSICERPHLHQDDAEDDRRCRSVWRRNSPRSGKRVTRRKRMNTRRTPWHWPCRSSIRRDKIQATLSLHGPSARFGAARRPRLLVDAAEGRCGSGGECCSEAVSPETPAARRSVFSASSRSFTIIGDPLCRYRRPLPRHRSGW